MTRWIRRFGVAGVLSVLLWAHVPGLTSARTAAAADDSKVITREDNGSTVTLQVGDRFLLKLGEEFDWTAVAADQSVVSRVPNIAVVRGAQGVYEARGVGETDLNATGTPRCNPGQPCPQVAAVFRVHLSVRGSAPPPQQPCPILPLWVNDPLYGNAGLGYYVDPPAGIVWTAERGWHAFAPRIPRLLTAPLWVNTPSYGSAGGGFYWDPVSGLVWTSERNWHPYAPQACVRA